MHLFLFELCMENPHDDMTIQPRLEKTNTATESLRDIKIIMLIGQGRKKIHQQILVVTPYSRWYEWTWTKKIMTVPQCLKKTNTDTESLSKIKIIMFIGQVSKKFHQQISVVALDGKTAWIYKMAI